MGRSRNGQGEPSGHAAGVTAARPHFASVFSSFREALSFMYPYFIYKR